jgi:hypothetical protein
MGFLNVPIPSNRTIALVMSQHLTEMRASDFLGGIERRALKADNLTAICKLIA